MKYLLPAAMAILVTATTHQPAAELPVTTVFDEPVLEQSVGWQAQVLINTMFSELTPGFNDLYMIETPDKGRQIVIYCNPSYCYKLRGHHLTA